MARPPTDDEFTGLTARFRAVLRLVPVPVVLAVLGLGRSPGALSREGGALPGR